MCALGRFIAEYRLDWKQAKKKKKKLAALTQERRGKMYEVVNLEKMTTNWLYWGGTGLWVSKLLGTLNPVAWASIMCQALRQLLGMTW